LCSAAASRRHSRTAPERRGSAILTSLLEGNGGYDVQHYDLTLAYEPATDQLDAINKITATATQDLLRFDLDFQQLWSPPE